MDEPKVARDDKSNDMKTKSTRARQIELVEENAGMKVAMADDQSHGDQNHKAKHHLGQVSGTAVELWKNAVGLFPEIVEEHGEFSEELLKAMLGIDS